MIVATGADSRKCPCGQVGCVEAYSSAYNTSKRLAEADVAGNTGVAPVDPSDGGKDVLTRFARGDETAVKVLEEVKSLTFLALWADIRCVDFFRYFQLLQL